MKIKNYQVNNKYCINTTNNLQNNYKLYFNWIVQTHNDPNWTPNLQNCYTMASKCPIKQGNIIYAFRNLYNYITQEIHEFEDNCDASARGGNGNNYGFIRLKQKPTVSIVSNSSIKIYPNPTIGIINIANKKVSQILVTNSLGKIVYQNKVIASQLNLSHLPNGLYIIRLIANDGKTETDKLIIQH